MKKVLFVANTLQIGGAERILVNVLKNIDKTKYDVTVLALVDYGVLVDEIKKIEGIKYIGGFKGLFNKTKLNSNSIFYKFENKLMMKKLKKYSKELKNHAEKYYPIFVKEKYDIEVAFLEGRVSRFVACSTNKDSKKISWIHTDVTGITKENFKDINDEIKHCARFDKIVCVSNVVKEKFIEKTGIKDNVIVQFNPIDSVNILKMADDEIEGSENDNDNNNSLTLCAVGRIEPVKGYDRLLEVHKRLIDEGILHKLWFVGDGKQKYNLEKYVKDNNLNLSVKFWGYQKNPYKYIKKSDIYVCSSYIEGLSSTALEAAVLGKAIITTDCPGMKEIFGEHNDNALIVNNDTEALYSGLKQIILDKEYRTLLETNIKKQVRKFNLKNTMQEIENILDN